LRARKGHQRHEKTRLTRCGIGRRAPPLWSLCGLVVGPFTGAAGPSSDWAVLAGFPLILEADFLLERARSSLDRRLTQARLLPRDFPSSGSLRARK